MKIGIRHTRMLFDQLFYGVSALRKVNYVNEPMTIFDGSLSVQNIDIEKLSVNIFPNPESDLTAIQVNDLVDLSIIIELFDAKGKLAQSKVLKPESMILYFDIQALYSGIYFVNISSGNSSKLH